MSRPALLAVSNLYYNFPRIETPGWSIGPRTGSSATLDVPMEDLKLILRFTRHWIHYGFLAHIGICTVVAAVEGLLGR
jgi:hypothetical protein